MKFLFSLRQTENIKLQHPNEVLHVHIVESKGRKLQHPNEGLYVHIVESKGRTV